ncbi:MAG: nodulation protein NfeD [Armatimonadota bacterium]|nr:nodulation protein NfeD [Armatimonadota bacterium]
MTARRVAGPALLGILILAIIVAWGGGAAPPTHGAAPAPVIHRLTVDGVIGPATARFIARAVRHAEDAGAEVLVIQLDTPGGLLKSTDDITKVLLNARVPVVVYIAPRGARAASAGVFITYAAHIAAMAPATHLGAATPVTLGQPSSPQQQQPSQQQDNERAMREKVTNDAVANLRAIANRRGRNADWAEQAVREAVSITEVDAIRLNVANLVAENFADLQRRLDGMTVTTDLGTKSLRTAQARVDDIEMDVTEQFLSLLSDPNIGFILMNVGILGILVELYNPGAILPGVVGGIALILGLASFAILQVNVAGLLLIAFAVLLFIADVKVPGHGVLTVGGIIAFIFGAILLTERTAPVLQISLHLILAVAVLMGAFFLFAVSAGVRAQKAPVRSGGERLVGALGVARSAIDPEGMVYVQGEMWSAVTDAGPIAAGQPVRVVSLEGLRVRVRPEPPART